MSEEEIAAKEAQIRAALPLPPDGQVLDPDEVRDHAFLRRNLCASNVGNDDGSVRSDAKPSADSSHVTALRTPG